MKHNNTVATLDPQNHGKRFLRQFRILLFLAWALPPVVGLAFLVFIEIFSAAQVTRILFSLPVVIFLVATLIFTDWYFGRYAHPIYAYAVTRAAAVAAVAEQRIRRFPLVFWTVFLSYVLLAPLLVVTSARLHAGFEPQAADWFRIHLVALTVTIAVGLPIFFRFLDLFGRVLSPARLVTPHVTLRAKVFLIGALMPLLIDTMLVLYFWSRTGFFTAETFAMWLALEALAVAGSLMFVRSFSQSLRPLHNVAHGRQIAPESTEALQPMSTDELGVVTGRIRLITDELRLHHRILELTNRLLHNISAAKPYECFAIMGDTFATALGDDRCFVLLADDSGTELLCVSYTGAAFNAKGYFRLPLNAPTQMAQAFHTRRTLVYRAGTNQQPDSSLLPDFAPQSALLTPLVAEGQALGVLVMANTRAAHEYTDQDVLLVEGVAREAALVVKARLLHMQRLHTEERFRQLNELAQVTLESIGDGVITMDTFGSVIYMNQVAERLSGWTLEQARGKSVREVVRLRDEHTHDDLTPDQYERLVRTSHTHYAVLATRDIARDHYIEISAKPLENAKHQVIGAVLVLRDVSEIRRLVHKMSYQTSHDALTGLINRREFEAVLETALDAVREAGANFVVCYIDLDQFKVINDTCGHTAGDELIRQLATRLDAALGENDILARLGGDEFGVLIAECDQERGVGVAAHLLEVVKSMRFVWDDKNFTLAASIGVVPLTRQFVRITDVLSAADSACYVAKEHGRNRIHIFHENDLALATHHGQMQWMQRIQRALEENHFRLYFQPIVGLSDDAQTRHGEVLLRMVDGNDVVPPASFLPSAERYHLMPNIDRWVVRNMLGWMSAQPPSTDAVPYFINLSGQSLSDGQFLEFVTQELKDSGVPPQRVGFEITETAAIQNVSRATHFITSLKALGCRFSLDDFGSGVSSFSYLKNLPVDYLKIDGSFVWDMANDRINTAMVESINQIGHLMGIKTIAECVENDHTLIALKKLGVDYVQGYHLGVPRPLH